MRIRAVAMLGAVLAGGGVVAAVSAGAASAIVPVGVPAEGVIGVGFDHGETQALSNSPVPGILGMGLLAPITSVHVDPESGIPKENGQILADMPTVWRTAADAPNGKMVVALVDPTRYDGKVILVAEYQ
ncbi:hypothetical protein [Nocardia wallacei]|uniref:hypothetical protein n=1 Tax=Nocardia wallacei TaxID=480035 RepID=UPI002457489E|nr:hypothetical protein [Nocardia wallacei]